MNLARYKSFVNRLQRDATVTKGVSNIDVFRVSGEIWYDLTDQQITDNRLIRSLKTPSAWGRTGVLRKATSLIFPCHRWMW
jgi:hypothetical protein